MNDRLAAPDPVFLRNSMAAFVQIAAVLLLLSWCFRFIAPFVNVVAMGDGAPDDEAGQPEPA